MGTRISYWRCFIMLDLRINTFGLVGMSFYILKILVVTVFYQQPNEP